MVDTRYVVVLVRHNFKQSEGELVRNVLRHPSDVGVFVYSSIPLGRVGEDRALVVSVPMEHTRFIQEKVAKTKYYEYGVVYNSPQEAMRAIYHLGYYNAAA